MPAAEADTSASRSLRQCSDRCEFCFGHACFSVFNHTAFLLTVLHHHDRGHIGNAKSLGQVTDGCFGAVCSDQRNTAGRETRRIKKAEQAGNDIMI